MDSITSPKELESSDMDPSAVGINEPKETPPAVLHSSHPPNEIEVVEVTPATEPSSTFVPYIAPHRRSAIVTPPETELVKVHCFCVVHEPESKALHAVCFGPNCYYCKKGHDKVMFR